MKSSLKTSSSTADAGPGARASGLQRNDVVRLFGTPDETAGSVNEPRLTTEREHTYNEKWTYHRPRHEASRPVARHIYWSRYDFVGSERVERDGRVVAETEAELLRRLAAGHSAAH
jgi:hypothetical protein